MSKAAIYLRDLEESDIDERYASWFTEADGLLDFYTYSGRTFSRDSLLAELREAKQKQNIFFYAIVDSDTDRVIGNIKIGPIDKRHKISDLVALIGDRAYLGKGLAKEAIKLGNAIAFEKHDIRKLYGGMYAANIASVKAYTGAGWVIEATLKGQLLVDGKPMDRILVACFNPRYFPNEPRP